MNIEEISSLIRQHADLIRDRYKAEISGVFGSYARGEERTDSDLDLVVRFGPEASLFDLVGLSQYLEDLTGILRVDVVSERAIHPLIRDEVIREMVVL